MYNSFMYKKFLYRFIIIVISEFSFKIYVKTLFVCLQFLLDLVYAKINTACFGFFLYFILESLTSSLA